MAQSKLASVRQEALSEPIEITWRDSAFTIEPPDEWLLDFSHYAERNQITNALEAMLGAEQYEAFRTAEPRPKVRDAKALITQTFSTLGLDVGE